MTISIVKGVDGIVALIGSIATKQADYRNAVSSAVISSVAHSLQHGETSTITKLLNELFNVSYRDLKVVKAFIESVTPVLIEEKAEGRKKRVVIAAAQFMEKDYKQGATQKDTSANKLKALKRHNGRAELFDAFSTPDGVIQVRNLEWKDGDSKESKTVGVNYGLDIFKWYEDVEYIRKEVAKANEEGEVNPFEALVKDAYENAQGPVSNAIKALESLTGADRTDQVKSDITSLQEIATRIAEHVKIREAERVIATEVKTLENAGANKTQVKKWLEQREKRVTEGKEAEAITAEFNQYLVAVKEKVAAAAEKAAAEAEQKAA